MDGISLPVIAMSDADARAIRPFVVHRAPEIDEAWSNAVVEFQRKRIEASEM